MLSLTPTPYFLMAPGNAVDLSSRIAVDGHAPPSDRYYLTDVYVQRATVLSLLEGLLPGFRVLPQSDILPDGVSSRQYERVLVEAMNESQNVAAIVAERAAGFHVPNPPEHVYIREVLPQSKAGALLKAGDVVAAVAGRRVVASTDVARILAHVSAGTPVTITIVRGEATLRVSVPTIHTAAGTRFGIVLQPQIQRAQLPVAVHFSIDNISGSSGGLMFALQIYGALAAARHRPGAAIAGTGTIGFDGKVGPIEGTLQKFLAAKRAGAAVFLVPKQNYADVAAERGVRIVPVGTFNEALAALRS